MANPKLLTLHDLSAFVERLTYTIETAERGEHLTASLSRLFSSTSSYSELGATTRPHAKRAREPRIDPTKVLAAVAEAKDGIAVGELADQLHQSVARIRVALVHLRTDGKLVMKGTKRNALWFATKPTRQKPKAAAKDAQPDTAQT